MSAAAVVTSVESPDVLGSEEQARFEVPLGLLFFDFDKNGEWTKMVSEWTKMVTDSGSVWLSSFNADLSPKRY